MLIHGEIRRNKSVFAILYRQYYRCCQTRGEDWGNQIRFEKAVPYEGSESSKSLCAKTTKELFESEAVSRKTPRARQIPVETYVEIPGEAETCNEEIPYRKLVNDDDKT